MASPGDSLLDNSQISRTKADRKATCRLCVMLILLVTFFFEVVVPERQRLRMSLVFSYERDSSEKMISQANITQGYAHLSPLAEQQQAFALTHPKFAWSWSRAANVYSIDEGPILLYKVRGPKFVYHFKRVADWPSSNQTNTTFPETSLKRRIISFLRAYTIHTGDGKYGRIQKKFINLLETYHVYMASYSSNDAVYTIKSDLWFRNFWMRNTQDAIVAKISQHGSILLGRYYQVHVSEGMDSTLVLSCACAIMDKNGGESRRHRIVVALREAREPCGRRSNHEIKNHVLPRYHLQMTLLESERKCNKVV